VARSCPDARAESELGTQTGPYHSDLSSPTFLEELPAVFGRYELRRLLGRGGMGAVYLAHDSQLDRQVALKLPRLSGESHPEARARFLREARAAAGLRHPNICPVYDAGEIGQTLYLSMAYIEGETLSGRLARGGPLPMAAAAALTATVARAMQAAHDHGIIHRDLKPANLMLDSHGQPVVMDFGLAQRTTAACEVRLTQSGALLGTPVYMAPEQAGGDPEAVGPGCDIYSLGVILYEMLTGRVPFQSKQMGSLLAQVQRDPPPPPSRFRRDLPGELEAVCLKALAKTPEERFASMADFAAALAPFAAGTSVVGAPAVTQTVAYVPPRRRWRVRAAGIVLLAVLAVLAGALWYAGQGKGKARDSIDKNTTLTEEESPREKLAGLLREGYQLINQQRFAEAAVVAEQALQIDPQSPGALAIRGTARAGRGKRQEGLADCNAALKSNPETAMAYRTRGIIYTEMGRADAAIADLTVALRLGPNSTSNYINRCIAYLKLGEPEQATADASEALKRNAKLPKALGNRAAAYLIQGRHEEALADLNAALTMDPGSAHWHWVRSHVHAHKGDLTGAREDQEAAGKLDANYKGKKSIPVAAPTKRALPKLSETEAASVKLSIAQAELAHDKGDFKAVLKAADGVLRLDPDEPKALALKANALLLLGQVNEAWSCARRVVRLEPASALGYAVMGHCCLRRGEWARGISYNTISLRLEPRDGAPWNNRSRSYYFLGNYHQALADINKCLEIRRRAVNYSNRAWAHFGIGEFHPALADLDAAVVQEPLNPRWYQQRGAIHARLGNARQAKADQDRAVELAGPKVQLPPVKLPTILPPPHRDPELIPGGTSGK
jgi:tetratricopeptide (TPR) repeat protein